MPALSAHFSLEELDGELAPSDIQANLKRVALGMEAFRAITNHRPITVTSGFRTPEHNAEIHGSPTSDHVHGLACDGFIEGLSLYEVWKAYSLVTLPPYDQIEWDPTNQHIHWGFGERMRRVQLVKQADGSFAKVTLDQVQRFPGAPTPETATEAVQDGPLPQSE